MSGPENKSDDDLTLLRVMVAMAMSDDALETTEIEAICNIYKQLAGHQIPVSDVMPIVEAFSSTADDILESLASDEPQLGEPTKEKIIRGAYLVLLADGVIAAQEKDTLRKIADALKMPEIHYQSVLEELEAR